MVGTIELVSTPAQPAGVIKPVECQPVGQRNRRLFACREGAEAGLGVDGSPGSKRGEEEKSLRRARSRYRRQRGSRSI